MLTELWNNLLPWKKARRGVMLLSLLLLFYLAATYPLHHIIIFQFQNISTLQGYIRSYVSLTTVPPGEKRVMTKTVVPSQNISNQTGSAVQFTYALNLEGNVTYGWPIEVSLPLYTEINQWPEFIKLSEANARKHVMATAASDSYYRAARVAVASIQKYFPSYPIYFYDLGLRPEYVTQLKQVCNLQLRTFNFDKYPAHVHEFTRNFAWKAYLIRELLQEHPGVFYIDSSVRFFRSLTERHYQQAVTNGGFLFNSYTGHATFPVTHPDLFRFLPSNMTAMKTLKQYEGGDILVYRTEEICTEVLMPLLMCASYKPCIQPTQRSGCHIKSWHKYANCHRFDQSVMNILMQNHVGYDNHIVRARPWVVVIHRMGIGDNYNGEDEPVLCDSQQSHT